MRKTSLVVFMTTIMMMGVLGTSFVPSADALNAKGTGVSQYGSSTDICGLMLCSEYPGGKEAYQVNWFKVFLGNDVSDDIHSDTHDSGIVVPSAENTDEEFPAQLDEVIHKFELDKITAEDAMTGIIEVHSGMIALYITSDIIKGVEEKIALYESGKLTAADAVESIHLTAEPQNVNPEFIGALDEYLHKFELGKLSADRLLQV